MTTNPWHVGAGGVPRTGATSLSDSEVVLCDALFRLRTPSRLLECDDFGAMFNLPYELGLAPAQVAGAVTRLRERGVISEFVDGDERILELSVLGGMLWEKERLPVWDAFCSDSRRFIDGAELLRISASRTEVAEAYLAAGPACGLFHLAADPIEWAQGMDSGLIRWRPRSMITASVRLRHDDAIVDWNTYESRRIWWRDAPELLQSHGVLPNAFSRPVPPRLFGAF